MAKKILVVDDSATIRQSMVHILKEGGYEVSEGKDGVDGLSALSSISECDPLITDGNMPNMDGIELIKKVRVGRKHNHVPIIVLNTESQGSEMNEGKEAGATGWNVKPFSAEKLLGSVKKVAG